MKTGFIGWMDSMARVWSRNTQSNVCAVDWSRLASYAYTIAALSHTRKTAAHIVDFIKVLEANGADVGEMSIIGHSLGAQIAGFVGSGLDGKFKAIYGLDPAGPGFTFPFQDSREARLDDTDAKYVQCIHTSRLTLGVNYTCGHSDFYPNGGFMMPGCLEPICSHLYVVALFHSSLDPVHSFVGTHCNNDIEARYHGFQCTSIRDTMGIHNDGVKGSFYLYTSPHEPYCMNCMQPESTEKMKISPRYMKLERRRLETVSAAAVQMATPASQSTATADYSGTSMTSATPNLAQSAWKIPFSSPAQIGYSPFRANYQQPQAMEVSQPQAAKVALPPSLSSTVPMPPVSFLPGLSPFVPKVPFGQISNQYGMTSPTASLRNLPNGTSPLNTFPPLAERLAFLTQQAAQISSPSIEYSDIAATAPNPPSSYVDPSANEIETRYRPQVDSNLPSTSNNHQPMSPASSTTNNSDIEEAVHYKPTSGRRRNWQQKPSKILSPASDNMLNTDKIPIQPMEPNVLDKSGSTQMHAALSPRRDSHQYYMPQAVSNPVNISPVAGDIQSSSVNNDMGPPTPTSHRRRRHRRQLSEGNSQFDRY